MENEFIDIPYTSVVKITRQKLFDALQHAAQHYATGNLVDLGCGIKPYEDIFKVQVINYIGVDYKPTMVANYQELTKADLFSDCCNTGLGSESFDTVLCTQVMEHVYDFGNLAQETYRLLKKGGYAIFTIPFLWPIHAEPNDFFRFTQYSIEEIFNKLAFEIIELRPTEGAICTMNQMRLLIYTSKKINIPVIRFLKKVVDKLYIIIINYISLRAPQHPFDGKMFLNYLLVVKK